MKLSSLGFNKWFKQHCPDISRKDFCPARICTVNKDNFRINGEHGEMQAQMTGRLRFETEATINTPTVGDWVIVEYLNDYTRATIHNVFPRKTLLKRKVSGKKMDYQLIGANLDFVCIMQSLDIDFNIPRLERYLVAVFEASIIPIILLSKCDLITASECKRKSQEIRELFPDRRVIVFSNKSGDNLDEVADIFVPANTYCIIGSSGVGKTTLLNKLLGTETYATSEMRKNERGGRHTTTRRQLIPLKNGALYIDTPGMRELGIISADSGIEQAFPDIELLAEKCHFPDCTHTHEPECAIQKALKSDELSQKRFKNYIKLRKESEHHARSHAEKRKKLPR